MLLESEDRGSFPPCLVPFREQFGALGSNYVHLDPMSHQFLSRHLFLGNSPQVHQETCLQMLLLELFVYWDTKGGKMW